MKQLFILFFIILNSQLFAQSDNDIEVSKNLNGVNDTLQKLPWSEKYREDQIYFCISHDLFLNNPKDIQNNLSLTLASGFFRDFPISKNRKFAIAPGLGISYRRHNTFIYPNEISIIDSKLSINQWLIECPLEFRWRNSTVENSSFLRCHFGTKLSYRFYGDYNFNSLGDSNALLIKDMSYINPLTIQNYLVVGYSILNIYVAYTYQPFYKNSTFNGQELNTNSLSLGFIFYIL